MADLDQSLINFAQKESLEVLRQNSDYTFKQLAISCHTLYNNGGVTENNINYSNKCCFWSIYHGLLHNKIYFVNGGKLSVFNLMKLSGFTNRYQLIDTDNPTHQKALEKLLSYLPNIQLHFFIGKNNNGTWQTTPDASATLGSGSIIIRILNTGSHFEFITNPNTDFVRDPKTMNLVNAYKNQMQIETELKQKSYDQELSERLALEESITQSKILASIPTKSRSYYWW